MRECAFDSIFVNASGAASNMRTFIARVRHDGQTGNRADGLFCFCNEERPHQSLDYSAPAVAHHSVSGGGGMILEKCGDSIPETSDPLHPSDVSGSIVKDVKLRQENPKRGKVEPL